MSDALPQRYRVLERLAAGGMAEVFLGESAGIEGFKKLVAIKRVLPALSEKKRFIAMFLDEARLSAHLTHSNVAQVFDIGVGGGAYFIVMEYVDGGDLRALSDHAKKTGKSFPVEVACYIAVKICEGLTYAHELIGTDGKPLRIVHRDMSPPNVLITKHGEVKIVDFGLARATSQLEKSEAGIIKGKFGYLSPEAASGLEIDHRTDIFAAGIILWELLAGRRLFLGETDFDTVKEVQEAKVPSLTAINPAVPAELEKILARALAKDPRSRYATARDLGKDLTTFLYHYGRPVGAYDVAEVVRAAHTTRKPRDRASIIDKLIEEALLQFTSLQDDEPAAAPTGPEPPAKAGFEDIGQWANELGIGTTIAPKAGERKAASAPPRKPEVTSAAPPATPPPRPASAPPKLPSRAPPTPQEQATPQEPIGDGEGQAAPLAKATSGGTVSVGVTAAIAAGAAIIAWVIGYFLH